MAISIFKDSNGVYRINGNSEPTGTYRALYSENRTKVTIVYVHDGSHPLFPRTLITEIQKEDGSTYGNTAEFEDALKDFFSSASTGGSSGGGGTIIPDEYYFANAAARDAYFNPSRLDELLTGMEIVLENDGSGNTIIQRWYGESNPSSYDNTFWQAPSGGTLTAAQIKALYESNPNTNEFDDSEKSILSHLTETSDKIISDISWQFPPESVFLSEALGLEGAVEAIGVFENAENRRAYLVGYNRLPDGSGRPFYRKLGAEQLKTIIQGNQDTDSGNPNFSVTITIQTNRLVTAFYIIPSATTTTGKVTLSKNGSVIASLDGINGTANTELKLNFPQGMFFKQGDQIVAAFENLQVKGTGSGPTFQIYLAIDWQPFTIEELAEDGNVVHIDVPDEWASVTEKGVPVVGDRILIEDSENGFVKRTISPFAPIAAMLKEGTNVTIDFDNTAGTATINSTGGTPTTPTLQQVTEAGATTDQAVTFTGAVNATTEFNTSNTSPLGSSPGGTDATAGYVLTADGSGNSSWQPGGGGTYNKPVASNFSINIPANVNLNTDLNNLRNTDYNITHSSNVASIQLVVSAGDNKTLTNPTMDGDQPGSVILSGIDTSTAKTISFRISGVDTQGGNFSSNTQNVVVRNPTANENIYYGIGDIDPATVDPTTLTAQFVNAPGQFDVTLGPSALSDSIVFLAPTDHDLTEIINKALNINVISAYSKVPNARTIGGTSYNSYELDNLNPNLTFNYTIKHN